MVLNFQVIYSQMPIRTNFNFNYSCNCYGHHQFIYNISSFVSIFKVIANYNILINYYFLSNTYFNM